jgi:hypothetical protein
VTVPRHVTSLAPSQVMFMPMFRTFFMSSSNCWTTQGSCGVPRLHPCLEDMSRRASVQGLEWRGNGGRAELDSLPGTQRVMEFCIS